MRIGSATSTLSTCPRSRLERGDGRRHLRDALRTVPDATAAPKALTLRPMDRPHHKFWPARLQHAITPPATSLWHNLAVSALRYPDKAAIVFFGRIYTYLEVMRTAERLAACLASLGVKRGDRVILDMQN